MAGYGIHGGYHETDPRKESLMLSYLWIWLMLMVPALVILVQSSPDPTHATDSWVMAWGLIMEAGVMFLGIAVVMDLANCKNGEAKTHIEKLTRLQNKLLIPVSLLAALTVILNFFSIAPDTSLGFVMWFAIGTVVTIVSLFPYIYYLNHIIGDKI